MPVNNETALPYYEKLLDNLRWDEWEQADARQVIEKKYDAITVIEQNLECLNNYYWCKFVEQLDVSESLKYLYNESGVLAHCWKQGNTNTIKTILGMIKDQVNKNYNSDSHILKEQGSGISPEELARINSESKVVELMSKRRGRFSNIFASILGLQVGLQGKFNSEYAKRIAI